MGRRKDRMRLLQWTNMDTHVGSPSVCVTCWEQSFSVWTTNCQKFNGINCGKDWHGFSVLSRVCTHFTNEVYCCCNWPSKVSVFLIQSRLSSQFKVVGGSVPTRGRPNTAFMKRLIEAHWTSPHRDGAGAMLGLPAMWAEPGARGKWGSERRRRLGQRLSGVWVLLGAPPTLLSCSGVFDAGVSMIGNTLDENPTHLAAPVSQMLLSNISSNRRSHIVLKQSNPRNTSSSLPC